MQATITDAGTLRKKLTVTYAAAEVNARREQVLKKFAGQVKLDGFRPGKSSKALVEKRFGSAAEQQAREELSDEGFKQGVAQHQLKPIGPLKNESSSTDNGLTFSVSFEVKPTIELPAPSALSVANTEITVADADLAEALNALCKRAGTLGPLNEGETVQEDDSITLVGSVTVAGKEVRKLHDFHHLVGGYSLLGKAPAEVIAAFAGKGIGAEVRFSTTLPGSFAPVEAANQPAEVAVTVQSAQRQRPATPDDALAKRLGVESIDDLKARLRDQLKQQKELEQHQKQITELTDALLAKTSFAVPPELLAGMIAENVDPRVAQAEKEGKSADEIAKLKSDGAAEAEKSLKRYLLIDAVAEAHQVQVSRDDLESQIQMAAQRSGRKPQEIADQLGKSGQVNQVVQEIREAKALEVLLDKVLGRGAEVAQAKA